MLFETDRLIARRLTNDDVNAMFAIYGDRETMRYVGDSEPLTREACRGWVDVTDRNFENRGYGMVALIEKSTGDLVGCAGLVHPDQRVEAEIKYAFLHDCQGRGLATEAVRAFVQHGHDVLGLGQIVATVAPENAGSQRVLTKAGFVHVRDETNDDDSTTQYWLWRPS